MSGYTPRFGDRVRVVIEGTVRDKFLNQVFTVGDPDLDRHPSSINPRAGHVVSIERLPDPEPEWQPGDVVRAADGKTYVRTNNDWDAEPWLCPHTRIASPWRAEGELPRPLTLLVRDGKQVQP